ncbi:MAG: rRNA maturation RNase YbeY [Planctomycetes bacterium]|nr:rRNA maturation RNase YbeY [Planctomycetota bacterium]
MIKIHIANRQGYLTVNRSLIVKIYKSVLKGKQSGNVSVSLVITDNRTIRETNRLFLRHNRITDVMSFPLSDDSDNLLGEIFVSAQKALQESRKRKIPAQQELLRYCVHGLLHLLGYDDTTLSKKKIMWEKQEALINLYFNPSC